VKIGVMTFWWSEDNYGQLLQCYALQKYLRDLGHDTYLIRYDPRGDYIKSSFLEKVFKALNPVTLFKYLSFKKRVMIDAKEKRGNPRYFEKFRDQNIRQSEKIYYSYNELAQDPPDADMYIVGSDQVWNMFGVLTNRAINMINAYFLNFGDSITKKISYAASFGKEKSELDEVFVKIFAPLLKKFDYVSVREKSGLEICRQCGIDKAEWVPDPTLLLDADEYRALYVGERLSPKPEKQYVLLYLIGNEFSFSIQSIYDWAQHRKLEVVYITGNSQQDSFKKTYATVLEWIYLLENAEYVVTNSFHCTVFSLIFGKKFGVIPLSGRDKGMNSRFDSIFRQFWIDERFLNLGFPILDEGIDWQHVSKVLQDIKSCSRLEEIIRGDEECL